MEVINLNIISLCVMVRMFYEIFIIQMFRILYIYFITMYLLSFHQDANMSFL